MNSMKKTKEGINLKKLLRLKNTGSIFVIAGLLIILVIASYTYILQSSYTKTALETEITRDTASADAALMMQLGAEGVFVGSGIFKSGNPAKRAAAIVQAVTNYTDAKLIAELSADLGEAMVGINEQEIALLMAERGK